jgi:hypothetical protein
MNERRTTHSELADSNIRLNTPAVLEHCQIPQLANQPTEDVGVNHRTALFRSPSHLPPMAASCDRSAEGGFIGLPVNGLRCRPPVAGIRNVDDGHPAYLMFFTITVRIPRSPTVDIETEACDRKMSFAHSDKIRIKT